MTECALKACEQDEWYKFMLSTLLFFVNISDLNGSNHIQKVKKWTCLQSKILLNMYDINLHYQHFSSYRVFQILMEIATFKKQWNELVLIHKILLFMVRSGTNK